MTRKTSAYARKLRRTGDRATFNGAAWLNTIERCRPYSDQPVPGSWLAPNIGAAVKMDIKIHDALQRLLDHKTAADNTEDHDLMAHALGVAEIRALQIGGINNPARPALRAGGQALARMRARWERLHTWGLDGPGRADLVAAIDVYSQILAASSPAQMAHATQLRNDILDGNHTDPYITDATTAYPEAQP